jgi:hypothetical protein
MKTISEKYLSEQKRLHELYNNYGTASISHAPNIIEILKNNNLKSICDYGAGKMNLKKAMHENGYKNFEYFPYDPVFPEYGKPSMSELVCCIDVMEHIEEEFIENVLNEIRDITINLAYFSIATTPAKKILSDGRNAHITLKPERWWLIKLCSRFDIKVLQQTRNGFIVICKKIEQYF